MYLEFIYSISDYYKTLDKKSVIFEIILPFIIGGCIFYLLFFKGNLSHVHDYRDNVLTLLGVLVGFSITIITILTTGTSRNITLIQQRVTSLTMSGNPLSLFDVLLINFTYSVIIEVLLIVAHLIYPFILTNYEFPLWVKVLVFSILFSTVIHVLLLTIRNMTNFYFILIKKGN
jgi:hypothetical protein